MGLIISIPSVFAVLAAVYLFCIKPNTRRKNQMQPFEKVYIAHRGLFDNEGISPENSRMAFRRAVAHGFGIELDVRLTADNQMIVFHDDNLKRVCGIHRAVIECTYSEIKKYTIMNSSEKIPLLQEVLNDVAGKVPLIIEIKSKIKYADTVKKLAEIMQGYHGIYCIESFNPLAVAWYRRHHPEVLRGQLSTGYPINKSKRFAFIKETLFSNLLLNWYSKPDFIAYNHKHAGQIPYRLCRKFYRVESAAWTIQSQEELNRAKKVFQVFIFDGFIPRK